MDTHLILVNDYCRQCHIEPSFIIELEEGGLLELHVVDGTQYIPEIQLYELERYVRLHYDLSINIEGIDAICHLLRQIDELHEEIRRLKKQ